jgi:hypothetical protein
VKKATALALLLGTVAVGVEAAKPPAAPKPVAAAFHVSSCTSSTTCRQEDPAVAGVIGSGKALVVDEKKKAGGGSDSGFFALWAGSSESDPHGISARRFNKTAPLTGDALISPVAGDQYDPGITVQKAGTFVAVWSEVTNGHFDVKARRFGSTGAPLGNPIAVNVDDPAAPGVPDDLLPSVAPTKDGGFAVAWVKVLSGVQSSAASPQIVYRRFDAAGSPLGAQIALSQTLSNDRPALCVDSVGNVNVAWESVDEFAAFEPSHYGVSLRRVSAAGVPLAAELVVAPPTSNIPLHPSISCASNNTFVVVWHTDRAPATLGTDIVGQKYDKNGVKSGAQFVINTTTAADQRNPTIAHDATNAFVVVWETMTSVNGSKLGIYGRRYTAAGKAGAQFEVTSHDITQKSLNAVVAPTSNAGNFVVVWQTGTKAIWARRYTP